MQAINEHSTLMGTVSGTVLTVAVNIDSQDILKTVVLAAIGAVVSFCISFSLKWLVKRLRK
ncbi:MAG TPA: hypothetical protein VF868_05475 [Bacteroidia bacterium]|jgi:hypothetical protein